MREKEMIMKTYTGLVIERKAYGPEWEAVAFPKDDIDEAKQVLAKMRAAESAKKFPRPLRLVRETREYIDA